MSRSPSRQNSLGELRLNDETKLALGPGAKLKLDKFVYDPDKASGTVAVDLTKGAFRFITGVAKKNSYQIRSPNASISVRGTVFDVYVAPDGTMWVLLHEGSIEICNAAGQCKTINDPCGIVRVGGGGELSDTATWNRQPAVRDIDFETAFPFVVRPPQVDPAPRYTRVNVESGSCVADPIPPTPPIRRAEGPANVPAGPAPKVAVAPSPRAIQTPDLPPAKAPAVSSPPAKSASAEAESYEPAPPVASASAPVESTGHRWSGLYLGLTLGVAWQSGNSYLDCRDFTNADPSDCSTSVSFDIPPDAFNLIDEGITGGLSLGYNYKVGNLVAGLEMDIARTDLVRNFTEEVFHLRVWHRRVAPRCADGAGDQLALHDPRPCGRHQRQYACLCHGRPRVGASRLPLLAALPRHSGRSCRQLLQHRGGLDRRWRS